VWLPFNADVCVKAKQSSQKSVFLTQWLQRFVAILPTSQMLHNGNSVGTAA